jgi:hypothetical protein
MGDKLGDLADQWIAVVDNEVVARGKDAKEVFEQAKSVKPSGRIFIMKVPADKVMVL